MDPTQDEPQFTLKALSPEGIPAALQKAERYRLLNEPWQAESICRDILTIDAAHEQALITLVLAITDQFPSAGTQRSAEARQVLAQLTSEYKRAYYSGIIWERRATAQPALHTAAAGHIAYDALRHAMSFYEQAERIRPAGNDEALLRWNTCARMISGHPHIRPLREDVPQVELE
ncbi:MAG: hypothetical protein ACRENP_09690 [Longimicrobiales bacterium]